MTKRIWGTIRFYTADGEKINERRYYTNEARFEMILKQRDAGYYHIIPEWREKAVNVIPDLPKEIIRPVAEYSNIKIYEYK